MIGGNILSFTASDNVVTFYVKEEQSMSRCHVKALMNQHIQKLIDIGASIWWDSEIVYMKIGDVPDCKFHKVGFSYA